MSVIMWLPSLPHPPTWDPGPKVWLQKECRVGYIKEPQKGIQITLVVAEVYDVVHNL